MSLCLREDFGSRGTPFSPFLYPLTFLQAQTSSRNRRCGSGCFLAVGRAWQEESDLSLPHTSWGKRPTGVFDVFCKPVATSYFCNIEIQYLH